MKECENPECDNLFVPGLNNPHQKYCTQKRCSQKLSNARTRAYKDKLKKGISTEVERYEPRPVIKDVLYYLDGGT